VIAEIVAGNHGIGNVMLIASSNFNVSLVFAALLVVGIMGVGMYAIFDIFERRMTGLVRTGYNGDATIWRLEPDSELNQAPAVCLSMIFRKTGFHFSNFERPQSE